MTTLQLRLNNSQDLNRLIDDIVRNVPRVILAHPECGTFQPPNRDTIEHLVRQALQTAITGYRCCGERARCHSSLTPILSSPLGANERWTTHCQYEHRKLFLFHTSESYERFLVELEADLFNAVCSGAATRNWLAVKLELDRLLRDILAIHLFANPACEKCPFCTSAQRLDLWPHCPSAAP